MHSNLQRYDDQSTCPRCNDLDTECSCTQELELARSMRSRGLPTTPRNYVGECALARMDYDLAALQRMLREFGYK